MKMIASIVFAVGALAQGDVYGVEANKFAALAVESSSAADQPGMAYNTKMRSGIGRYGRTAHPRAALMDDDVQVSQLVLNEGTRDENNVDSYSTKQKYAVTHRPVYHKTVYNHYTATDLIKKDVNHHLSEDEMRNFDIAGKEFEAGALDVDHGTVANPPATYQALVADGGIDAIGRTSLVGIGRTGLMRKGGVAIGRTAFQGRPVAVAVGRKGAVAIGRTGQGRPVAVAVGRKGFQGRPVAVAIGRKGAGLQDRPLAVAVGRIGLDRPVAVGRTGLQGRPLTSFQMAHANQQGLGRRLYGWRDQQEGFGRGGMGGGMGFNAPGMQNSGFQPEGPGFVPGIHGHRGGGGGYGYQTMGY